MTSNYWLKRVYDKYNKAYFDNKLPADAIVMWDAEMPEGDLGHTLSITLNDDNQQPDTPKYIIRLSPQVAFDRNVTKATLLHEMAHLSLRPYFRHGKKFDAEMLRLACAGAFNGVW